MNTFSTSMSAGSPPPDRCTETALASHIDGLNKDVGSVGVAITFCYVRSTQFFYFCFIYTLMAICLYYFCMLPLNYGWV